MANGQKNMYQTGWKPAWRYSFLPMYTKVTTEINRAYHTLLGWLIFPSWANQGPKPALFCCSHAQGAASYSTRLAF